MEIKYYTVGETAKLLNCTQLVIYQKIKSKKLKAFKPFNKILITEESIKEFMDNSKID